MSAPTLTGAAVELADRLAPTLVYDGEDTGWMGTLLCGAFGAILDAGASLHDVVEDSVSHPGWTVVASPQDAPAEWLPWQADVYGVKLTAGITDDQKRTQINELPPHERGTTQAIIKAVKPSLTGTQTVRVVERPGGDGYAIDIITATVETPDATLTENLARSQKPAALDMTYTSSDAPLIDEGTRTIDAASGTIDTATLADIT